VSKLVVQEFLTLDGVMQAPGPNDDDRKGGFGARKDGIPAGAES
jgi:hypothetical protein